MSNIASPEIVQPETARNAPATRPRRGWFKLGVLAAVFLVALVIGIRSRLRSEAALKTQTTKIAIPSVAVAQPQMAASTQEIILPSNVQPYISSPIYARTDGYLKKWYFDIGAHVKAGQLLATIQAPEIDEQLAQARSTLVTSQANLKLADITNQRYQTLLQKHAVSQQEADNASQTYQANKAIVDANSANMRHYEALVSFEKVYAPFDGLITARNTDIGALINAGSSSTPRTDLFHIAQTGMLRVYVNVPEAYWRSIKPGETVADITLAEFPGKKFPGKVVRTSEAINGTTRTLLTEVDLPNPSNQLLSGSYAEVHLRASSENPTLLIPVNALIFRGDNLEVGVVRTGKAVLVQITPGHDLGAEIEVLEGLKPDDQVILNPPDSLVSGQEVTIVQASLPGDSK
jgi:RND family efflux transporter MFP subunit